MAYVFGADRSQPMLLPSRVDDYVAADAMVRVIDAFVASLDMHALGFERSVPAERGRPGFDPRDMLRLYVFGYLNGVRSSRRLERECRVNVEVMWLLGKLVPDYKTIADFRRDNAAGITGACRAFVGFCREQGLFAGAIAAIDGSKLRAAASRRKIMNAEEVAAATAELDGRIAAYLAEMDEADATEPDEQPGATAQALAALCAQREALAQLAETMAAEQRRLGVLGEAEARPMRHADGGTPPSYNLQIAVDPQSHLVLHHAVTGEATDNRLLLPMARAAREALGAEAIVAVADGGYANAGQAAECEASGIAPAVPAPKPADPGEVFPAALFLHDPATDTLTCPAGKTLRRNGSHRRDRARRYRADPEDCARCPLKARCTGAVRRYVYRPIDEAALRRANDRADKAMMRLRRQTVEHPFASIKRTLGGRFLLRGRLKAATEAALAVLAYNLTRAANLFGNQRLAQALA